ncbi:MAG TPA: hypothetical protein PKO06_15100 [Candidatus Ozemobacteraceae bacterium]|nr:hypothetical protein [Candidatus Ozemobacteraceae bacterium]
MTQAPGSYLIGAVEQAVAGGYDPAFPPISVSLNGALAKWRKSIQILDLRVNDPGLQRYQGAIEQTLTQLRNLSIDCILTLPEHVPEFFTLPPEVLPPPSGPESNSRRIFATRKEQGVATTSVARFQRCFLAVPHGYSSAKTARALALEDLTPILDLAQKHGLKRVIVPVSDPGLFLDAQSQRVFQQKFVQFHLEAEKRGIKLLVKNGGLSKDLFLKLRKETGCKLAFNLGTAFFERLDLLESLREQQEYIGVLFLHQALSGIDVLNEWTDRVRKTLNQTIDAVAAYQNPENQKDPADTEYYLSQLRKAFFSFRDARQNSTTHLGIFQHGAINFVPVLKYLKQLIEQGSDLTVFFEAVPNLKNLEFFERYVVSDILPAPI